MSPTDTDPEDEGDDITLTEPQQRAARTLDRNLTLGAGAGSGKTTTLTERYLAILGAHIDGPETLQTSESSETPASETEQTGPGTGTESGDAEIPRVSEDIERVTDPEAARRLPERIVVTTFTERAAEELTHEIRQGIHDRLADIDDPETWQRWRAAADGLDSASIHTIHGLCNRLLEEYATLPDAVDPRFDVLEEDEQTLLGTQIAAELVEEEPPEVQALARLYSRSQLETVLTDLISERRLTEDWLDLMESFENQTEYEAFLTAFEPLGGAPEQRHRDIAADLETVGRLLGDPDVRDRYNGNALRWFGDSLHEWWRDWQAVDLETLSPFEHLASLVELHDILTNGDNDPYERRLYFGGFRNSETEQEAAFAAAMERLLGTLDLEGYDIDVDLWCDREAYEPLQALASLTRETLERYDREKARVGGLDYDDLIAETHRLLTDHESQQLTALREDIWYVMVDEFQDTNHRQWELVRALVAAGEFDADNVFLVGDEKQSIYRFRNADVTVFDLARRDIGKANDAHGTPDDGTGLRTNFRTLPATLDAINGLFESVFTAGPDNAYEVSPEPLTSGRDATEAVAPHIEYLPVPVETDLRERFLPAGHDLRDLPGSEPSEVESRALANRLAELLADDTTVTADGENGSPVTPGDIAVLMRSRGDLKDYERALRRVGIPYRVVKGEGFFETPEIRALRTLLEALVDPTDDIALYGVLRSPLCGLADDELADAYDPSATGSLWEQLQTADAQTVRTAVADIRRWRRYAGTADGVDGPSVESWAVLLDRVLEETGYLAAVAADERGVAATANVDRFRDKLREFDADGLPSLERVVRRLDTQATQGGSEADANVVRDDESVTLMTIHEAKGQEFPVVVIPGIGREFRDEARVGNGSIELERVSLDGDGGEWASGDGDPMDKQGRVATLGLKVPGDWGESDRNTFVRHVAQAQRRREEAAEEKRILYVGCTRAEDHLVLTGRHTADDDEETGIEAPDPEDPSSMRDWVQAALFGSDDAATEAWTTLERDGQFTRDLEFDIRGNRQSGTVTVRLPPQERDVAAGRAETAPATQRPPYTPELEWELRTSPSDLSGLADGSVRWAVTEETRRAQTVRTDGTTGSSGPRQGGPGAADGAHLQAAVFGQAVHRLCEVRPPRAEWPAFVRQVATAQRPPGDRAPADIPQAAIEAVTTAAASALEYLDTLHDQVEPRSTHDEFPISLAFDTVELTGYIDHLAVTGDSYYVVDYKTDRKRDEESLSGFLDRRRAHHEPQVMAYAAALQAHDPTRDVDARLYFTDIDDSVRWTPGELASAQTSLRALVSESLPNRLTVERS